MSKRRAKPVVDRSQRYAELVAEGKARGCDPAWALTVLQFESLEQAIVAGGYVDTADFLKLAELIKSLQPPPAPVKVTIRYVNSLETMCASPTCDHIFKPPEYSDEICKCPKCGCQFDPETTERMREKKRAAAKASLPPPDATPTPATPQTSENNPPAASEVKASAPVPARPAPPPPPPAPLSEAWQAFNRMQGYGKSLRDGGLCKGGGVPHVDPNLTPPRRVIEDYNNSAPSVWTGYQNRQNVVAEPDVHPYKNSDGSPRSPHKAPY